MRSGDPLSPENICDMSVPFREIAVTYFDERISDVSVSGFNYAVGLRIVGGDSDVGYAVCFRQPLHCCHHH